MCIGKGKYIPSRAVADRQYVGAEADVRFVYRFLIDRGIRGAIAIDGPSEAVGSGLTRFRNPKIAPASCRPELRTLSIDLETEVDGSAIFSVALVGADADEVHLVSETAVAGAVR